mmetsp:Transcript_39029/g.44641  ORF Transcript_39029/g.44641 Transcript_39029/m.44641 type:complete len:145 (+) Transcript_39029:81-515(+)|eukprot:CAMPEP_0168335206 /NCGR_PEP_ID=MMETSP0213-20121227/10763_1 /TAXON_ID=151035 /ORGANISM="Euplotes harpa, Strain FSP1.4" /LENGTH=144 /DNA_ID=CAMNT_0008340073 /DNA_START=62 /DNA_END=496 /DNA_ORIENTATION=-
MRKRTFQDVIRIIKKDDGWGTSPNFNSKPVEINIRKLSIKDGICEKEIEDDTTFEVSSSHDRSPRKAENTVSVFKKKDSIQEEQQNEANNLSLKNAQFFMPGVSVPSALYTANAARVQNHVKLKESEKVKLKPKTYLYKSELLL